MFGLAPIAALCIGTLCGCAGARRDEANATRSGWLTHPPPGCVVGFSGPTLRKGDAVRNARRSALRNLAAGSLGVTVTSQSLTTATDHEQYTLQETQGVVRGARILAMWSAMASLENWFRAREVYALACAEDARPELPTTPPYPDWVLTIPGDAGRACALAVAGPTLDPDDQRGAALRDGQQALAEIIESRIVERIEDDGRHLARVDSRLNSTDRARLLANASERLESEWLDVAGSGPLGLKGVLYGLVCAEP